MKIKSILLIASLVFGAGLFSLSSLGLSQVVAIDAAPDTMPQPVEDDCVTDNDPNTTAPERLDSNSCGIIRYIVIFINVLSVMAGIVITTSMIIGGIQYSAAGSDPQKVSGAKERIRNSIIALILFVFGYTLLEFLIPGGLIG